MAEKIVIEIDLEKGDVSGATDAIAKAGGEAGEKAAAKLKKALKKDNRSLTGLLLWVTLGLGGAFVVSQMKGFEEIMASGYYFTGASSNITMSYIYVIAALHIAHVVAGLISLIVVIYNHYKQKYNNDDMLGFELASTFWHFVDVLWLMLFFFLYFFRYFFG